MIVIDEQDPRQTPGHEGLPTVLLEGPAKKGDIHGRNPRDILFPFCFVEVKSGRLGRQAVGPGSSYASRMARDAWLNHLAQVPLFAQCDKKELQHVAAATIEVSVESGKVLVREGEPGHECFVIVVGTATVTRKGETIASLGAGDVVGELAPLTGGNRTATVTADSAMEVLVIGQRELNGLLDEVPGFAVRLLHNLADRMSEDA